MGEDCDENDDGEGDGDDDDDDDGEEGEAEGPPTYPHSPGLVRRKWISRLFGNFGWYTSRSFWSKDGQHDLHFHDDGDQGDIDANDDHDDQVHQAGGNGALGVHAVPAVVGEHRLGRGNVGGEGHHHHLMIHHHHHCHHHHCHHHHHHHHHHHQQNRNDHILIRCEGVGREGRVCNTFSCSGLQSVKMMTFYGEYNDDDYDDNY